jgi:integrase
MRCIPRQLRIWSILSGTALSLAYACGLRATEVVRPRGGDIDSEQMIIRIVQSRGRKGPACDAHHEKSRRSAQIDEGELGQPEIMGPRTVVFREVHASRAKATILILAAFSAGFEYAIVCAYNSCTHPEPNCKRKRAPKRRYRSPSQT